MLAGSEKLRRRELRMCYEKEDKQWSCGKAGLSSIMRDIGEPCLHHSPIKVVITIRLCKTVIFWICEMCFNIALYKACYFLSRTI